MSDAFDVPAGKLMQVLIDGALDGVLAFDRDLRIAVWSPMLERLTGLRACTITGS